MMRWLVAIPAVTATILAASQLTSVVSVAAGQHPHRWQQLGTGSRFSQGYTVQTWDALGITTDRTYNLADQPLSTILPATGMNGPGNSYTLNTYQYVGGPLASVKLYDESGLLKRTVNYAYGLEGEPLTATGNTEPVSHTWDSVYRLKTLSDGNGNPTTYAYNTAGYLSLVTYPGSDTLSYPSYAADGALLQRVDGRGIVTNYGYTDPDGLCSAITYPAFPAMNVGLSYDSYGRLSTMTDGQGSHSYGFDDNDLPTTETTTYTGLAAKALNWTYYPDGSRAAMTGFAGNFAYYYDGAGRMTSLTNPFGETTQWSYLNNDWLKTQQLHNNATSTWTYDALARTTDLVTRSGPGAMDPLRSSFTGMTYDGASNRLSLTASIPHHTAFDGTTTYQYDTKDQLTQESSTRAGGYTNNFVYDPAGNPTTFKGVTATFNSNNQRTSDVHDGNGNPTTYKGVTCTFDPENRMTSYGTVMTAGYRGDGLRAWKQTAAGRVYFLYDGAALLAEMNASGAVTAVNTWGAAGVVSRNSVGTTVYYTFDPHGSVAQRQDGTGSVLTSHVWDAYGTGGSSGAYVDSCGYAGASGYYYDSESGLNLCTSRYFDSALGRFLNRDGLGYAGGVNLYSYAENEPVDGVDPLGTSRRRSGGRNTRGGNLPPGYVSPLQRTPGEVTSLRITQLQRQWSQAQQANYRREISKGGDARNRALFEIYKRNLRRQMEMPFVRDPKLQKEIQKLYRENATVGCGSTADAIRFERATGMSVGGVWHTTKGIGSVNNLTTWLRNNPNALHGDRAAAENVRLDLLDALYSR